VRSAGKTHAIERTQMSDRDPRRLLALGLINWALWELVNRSVALWMLDTKLCYVPSC